MKSPFKKKKTEINWQEVRTIKDIIERDLEIVQKEYDTEQDKHTKDIIKISLIGHKELLKHLNSLHKKLNHG